jgi:outer membrane protein TolC
MSPSVFPAFPAEVQYAQSTVAVSVNLVQLYKALGGGWEAVFPPAP